MMRATLFVLIIINIVYIYITISEPEGVAVGDGTTDGKEKVQDAREDTPSNSSGRPGPSDVTNEDNNNDCINCKYLCKSGSR